MKKVLFLFTTFFVILITSCSPWVGKPYTPFIDLDLLGSIDIGDTNYEVIQTLGEPLIIVKDYTDKEIWKYNYRYKNRVPLTPERLGYTRSGGLTTTEEYTYSEEESHNIFIHFKNNKVTQISVDNISRK